MDPLTILTALSGLGSLGGFMFRDNSNDKLRKMMEQLTSPDRLMGDADTIYSRLLLSPAFSAAKRNAIGASNMASSNVAHSLAMNGLGASGIGSISRGVGNSLAGFNMANLHSSAYNTALQQAMSMLQMRAGAGYGRERNIPADVYSAFLGSLGPLAIAYGQRGRGN